MARPSIRRINIEGRPVKGPRGVAVGAILLAGGTAAVAVPDLANPAAALCVKNGATVTNETAPNGAQRGICVFPNGTRIDEWAYFRNKHRTQH